MTMARAEIRIHGEEAAILRKSLAPEAGREIPGTRVKTIQKQEKALGERYEDLQRKIQAALGGPQAG